MREIFSGFVFTDDIAAISGATPDDRIAVLPLTLFLKETLALVYSRLSMTGIAVFLPSLEALSARFRAATVFCIFAVKISAGKDTPSPSRA
ncbi:hypothetical protein AIN02nite_27770 [Acetobacter indonesiensis]|uniref:Uncharacterized protein n=1 Tax=Acetobacter indonesiensis TaxID=104101 RepID=A0A6N3T6C8_9PROT|nr:hypothetical protein AIN02nite_27770 [Acetobacter indonesiensis]